MTNLSGAAVAALLVISLAACSDSDEKPGSSPASTPAATTATPTATPTPAAGRLVAQESGGSFCTDDLERGDVLAFTGPHLVVEDGPVTITGASSGSLEFTKVRAVQFTPGGVRQPAFVVADTLDELDPEGKPYLEDTEGALEGETFDAGTGVVPLIEVRATWPGTAKGGDVFVEQPPITVTWRADGGEEQVLEVSMPVEIHSLDGACKG